MDKKKEIMMRRLKTFIVCLMSVLPMSAQEDIDDIIFCGNDYKYEAGSDSITLYLKIFDQEGQKANVRASDLTQSLRILENGKEIPTDRVIISAMKGIPKDYTFSVLIDQGIPVDGKKKIFEAVKQLVDQAPDSCVYISFFGDDVSKSMLATRKNYEDKFDRYFDKGATRKYFYGAIYSKLIEFADNGNREDIQINSLSDDYIYNTDIARRAKANPDKNIMFVFTDGGQAPTFENKLLDYGRVTDYQKDLEHIGPKIFSFYYNSGAGLNEDVELTLGGVTGEKSVSFPEERKGKYVDSSDLEKILSEFSQAVEDQMYDFVFIYKATEGKTYNGKVEYAARWDDNEIGKKASFSIGTPETPWPLEKVSTGGTISKYLIALLVTFLTFAFFFIIMKILIPLIKSKTFAVKYYKKYEPEENVQKRICHYCKQPILPGQEIVAKCKHVMHVNCWKQNDYHCAEFGQNCKTGIQEHVDWSNLLSITSIRDCRQTLAGICAGLVSWIVYELTGRGGFTSLSEWIVREFLDSKKQETLFSLCVTKVSAFVMIGLLLGFFLSLTFRYYDEYRKKDATVYLKIIGLSLLSAVIGMLSFIFGAIIFCMILSSSEATFIPWYCSLPAYLLFTICTSLSLTIKSSIPVQSAMLGGICAAIIGFLILYFTSTTSSGYSWMNMLLDFVIYGGGLGASIITVRLLAEKYFLVIQNGVRAGMRIPIHKWMNAIGGGNKVKIGMTGECEIQMNWEKSNKVAKEHAVLYIDQARTIPVIKPLAPQVIYNSHAELPVNRPSVLSNGDTFKIGDTIFQYVETD